MEAGLKKRMEHKVSREFEKDSEQEVFLERLNDILEPHQEEDYLDLEETYPTLFIIGAPRSGTTLLSQLVSVHLDVRYINNLIAAFWKAPVYGVRLSEKLIPHFRSSLYQSQYGRTQGISEPHEFGYFWARFFGEDPLSQKTRDFEKQVDWERMRKVLINIAHAFKKPVVYKYLPMCWYVEAVGRILKKVCFVRVKRDPVQNAISIYNSRKKFLGSAAQWFSLKPLQYKELKNKPVWEQVAGQVAAIETFINDEIKKIDKDRLLDLNYTDLCKNPMEVLGAIKEMLNRNGGNVELLSEPERFIEKIIDPHSDEIYSKIARELGSPQNTQKDTEKKEG